MTDDYNQRVAKFSLTTKQEIKEIAKDPKAIFLDVRSPSELEAKTMSIYPYVHAQCTMDDTSKLTETASKILPDKDAPIIVFCGIGGRAMGAKGALENLGYTNVYNGGGLKDLE